MKVMLRVDTELDNPEELIALVNHLFNKNSNPEQKKIVQDAVCSKCGKAVDQKVVNFCKIKYKGTILCRECQEGK